MNRLRRWLIRILDYIKKQETRHELYYNEGTYKIRKVVRKK